MIMVLSEIFHEYFPYAMRNNAFSVVIMYGFIVIVDLILLIITSFNMIKLSRQLEHSEQNKFTVEKEWFFMFLELIIVMIFTWYFEVNAWHRYIVNEASIVIDIVKIYSSLLIFTIFVFKRDNVQVLLFQKYRGFNMNREEDFI